MRAIVKQLAALNRGCFGAEDSYSDSAFLQSFLDDGGEYVVKKDGSDVLGYYLFKESHDKIEGVRLGVAKAARGRGLGLRLVRRVMRAAKARGKVFETYTSTDNTTSFNLHVAAGARLKRVEGGWLYITTRNHHGRR